MIGTVYYGSVALRLTFCDLERKPVLSADATTFEALEYIFDVQCVYNPKATAFDGIGPNKEPIPSATAFAGTTDVALREYLAQPRRTLRVYYGQSDAANLVYVVSPDRGRGGLGAHTTDARNGPFCDVMSIKEHFGTKTFICHLRFRTYVACGDSQSPVLSHRTARTHAIDTNYFTTVVHTGVVTFDVGRLWRAELSPDFWRSEFFAAPDMGFRRSSINVEVSEDNRTCRYTVIDTEEAFNMAINSPCTRCEVDLSTGYSQGSMLRAEAQIANDTVRRIANIAQHGSIANIPTMIAAFAFGTIDSTIQAINANMPRYHATCHVRCWGSPSSTMYDLFSLALGIAIKKVGNPDFFTKANTTEISVSQSFQGRAVDVIVSLRWTDEIMIALVRSLPTLEQLFAGNLNLPEAPGLNELQARLATNGRAFYGSYFPPFEDVIPVPGGIPNGSLGAMSRLPIGNRPPGALGGNNRRPNVPPQPPGQAPNLTAIGGLVNILTTPPVIGPDLYCRGPQYLERIIANALSGQCENPPVIGFRDPSVSA